MASESVGAGFEEAVGCVLVVGVVDSVLVVQYFLDSIMVSALLSNVYRPFFTAVNDTSNIKYRIFSDGKRDFFILIIWLRFILESMTKK